MPRLPTLAYVEHALPGATSAERVARAKKLGLALEVAHRGDAGTTERVLSAAPNEVVTLQAWALHEDHPLRGEPERRARAVEHVAESLELAARHGIPRVLTVCGFGPATCADPFESCRAFFAELVPFARRRGVRLLIELLSPRRAGALTDPGELRRLVRALDAPDAVGVALDLGHLRDAGLEGERLRAELAAWERVEELQLRGPGSRPPEPDLPLAALLDALRVAPAVVCVEHRTPLSPRTLAERVRGIRGALERWAEGKREHGA